MTEDFANAGHFVVSGAHREHALRSEQQALAILRPGASD